MNRNLYDCRYFFIAILVCSIIYGCDEEETCFRCTYEKRKSGCNSYSYGSWETGELEADTEDIRSDLSKDEYCKLVFPSSDTECGGSCCISYQFRNVKVQSCP